MYQSNFYVSVEVYKIAYVLKMWEKAWYQSSSILDYILSFLGIY